MSKLVAFLAIPLLLSVPAALAQPGAGAPLQQAELGFGLYALGAKGLDLQLTMRRDAEDLQVEVAMRTAGMVDWAMRMVMTGQSAARIGQDGRVQPVRYITDSDGTWSKRLTRMSWDANGLPIAEVFRITNPIAILNPAEIAFLDHMRDLTPIDHRQHQGN